MVAEHHYDLVGAALLWTLREGLGDGFTSEVESAWTEVYDLVATVMKKAAAAHAGGAPFVRSVPQQQVQPSETPSDQSQRAAPLEDDVATLHFTSEKTSSSPPSGNLGGTTAASPPQIDVARAPAAVAIAPAAPQGFMIPLSGQDMVVNVHVKLDSPPAVATPASPVAEQPSSFGLAAGLLVALLCITASVGTAMVITMVEIGAGMAHLAAYGVPLVMMVLVLTSFALGHALGKSRSRSANQQDTARH
jgi:hypothetical protein